jgi:hypothetical protein
VATVSASFTAQYHGDCATCGGDVKGQEVVYSFDRDDLVHVTCPPTELEPPKGTKLCTSCFTYHNGECW